MSFTIPHAHPKVVRGYRCICGNTRLATYRFGSTLMRGMRWCDPCGRVVRKSV